MRQRNILQLAQEKESQDKEAEFERRLQQAAHTPNIVAAHFTDPDSQDLDIWKLLEGLEDVEDVMMFG